MPKFDKMFREAVAGVDRRSLLGRSAAAVGSVLAVQSLAKKAQAQAAPKKGAAPAKPDNAFTFSIVGEALCACWIAGCGRLREPGQGGGLLPLSGN